MFNFLNNLTSNKPLLSEEEAADVSPYIINRYLYFADGLEKTAQKLNFFTFNLDAYEWYLVAKRVVPKKYVRWGYVKKPKAQEEDRFISDMAHYYRVSKAEAKDYIGLLEPPQKSVMAKKFGYDKKAFKKMGLEFAEPKQEKLWKW